MGYAFVCVQRGDQLKPKGADPLPAPAAAVVGAAPAAAPANNQVQVCPLFIRVC